MFVSLFFVLLHSLISHVVTFIPSHSRYNKDDELLSRERHIIKLFVADVHKIFKCENIDFEILIVNFLIFHCVLQGQEGTAGVPGPQGLKVVSPSP